jgi:hypothetical protein
MFKLSEVPPSTLVTQPVYRAEGQCSHAAIQERRGGRLIHSFFISNTGG